MAKTSRDMSTKPEETLKGLLESANGARLSPADEEQAQALLKETLGLGKKGLAVSLEALTFLPWSLGVKAVAEAWPELKPTTRRQFLAALGKLDSDQGKRMRLSIARGLFPIDQPVAVKLILGFCSELDPAEAKDRQHFTNVLIGKTKPWILNLPLEGLKSAEINHLLKFTLAASQQSPAFTQIWVLGWVAQAGLFEKLTEAQIGTIATSVKRWQPRWKKELKKAVPTLPAPIEEALNAPSPEPAQQKPQQQPQKPAQASKKNAQPKPEAEPAREARPEQDEAIESAQAEAQLAAGGQEAPSTGSPEESTESIPSTESTPSPRSKKPTPPPQKPQPQQQPKQQQPQPVSQQRPPQRPQAASFDLNRTLGDIQSYVNGLKAEIQQLKNQLRQREPRRPEPKEKDHPTLEELETLRRHNAQLEDTAAQLRRDIEEMISDHEDRAATLGSSDDLQQFKALLGVKLGKDYFDFEALRRESATEVVRRHLGDLLAHIFSVLKTEGVEFKDEV